MPSPAVTTPGPVVHVSFRRSDLFVRLRSDYARSCFPELLTDSLTNSLAIYPVYHWSSQRQAGSLPDAGSPSLSLFLSHSCYPSPFPLPTYLPWVGGRVFLSVSCAPWCCSLANCLGIASFSMTEPSNNNLTRIQFRPTLLNFHFLSPLTGRP